MKLNTDNRSTREIIREAADSIDYAKLRAEAHLSPAEKLHLLFELCDQARENMFVKEQVQHPNNGDGMIRQRVRDRVLEQWDLSDKVRADLKDWIHRKENEATTV